MKTGKKIALGVSGIILLLVILLSGTGWFFYSHPDRIKALVEASLSDAIGASVTLSRLNYAINPFHVEAEGISVKPGDGVRGVYLTAPNFRADLSLTGPFGHKILVIEHLEVSDFSCRILRDAKVPSSPGPKKRPSFLSGLIKQLVALLVFRDVRLRGAALSNGNLTLQTEAQTLQATGIKAHLNQDHQIELSLSLSARWPSRDIRLLIPSLQVETDKAISLTNLEIKGRITIARAAFESPFADLKNLRVATTFIYNHDQGAVKLKGLDATLPAARVQYDGRKDDMPLGLTLKGDGVFNLKNIRLTIHPLKVVMRDALEFNGSLAGVLGSERKLSVDVETCQIIPPGLLRLLPPGIKRRIHWVDLRGPVHLTGRVKGQEAESDWFWDTNLTARFKKNPVSLKTRQIQLSGDVTGKIHGRGRVPDVAISAALSGDQIIAAGAGIELKPSSADFIISGTYPGVSCERPFRTD
ncbi:MAG: hypothetical protein U5R49_08215 [Deltaproteobacteria bacterium]|nr:hypothetical protein [Deltaproteobacteria bacterium]